MGENEQNNKHSYIGCGYSKKVCTDYTTREARDRGGYLVSHIFSTDLWNRHQVKVSKCITDQQSLVTQ